MSNRFTISVRSATHYFDELTDPTTKTARITVRCESVLRAPNTFSGSSYWTSRDDGAYMMLIRDRDAFRQATQYLAELDWDEVGHQFLFSAQIRIQKTLVSAPVKASVAELADLCVSRLSTMGTVLDRGRVQPSRDGASAQTDDVAEGSVLLRYDRERWRCRWVIND